MNSGSYPTLPGTHTCVSADDPAGLRLSGQGHGHTLLVPVSRPHRSALRGCSGYPRAATARLLIPVFYKHDLCHTACMSCWPLARDTSHLAAHLCQYPLKYRNAPLTLLGRLGLVPLAHRPQPSSDGCSGLQLTTRIGASCPVDKGQRQDGRGIETS